MWIRELFRSDDVSCIMNIKISYGLFVDIEADDCAAADFKTSTYESNLKLIGDVWSRVEFLKALPQEMRMSWAKYPGTVTCGKK
jgi:hypothetical protein